MKILITGGAGFIGCNAAAHYIKSGSEVTILDNLSRRGTEINLEWLKEQGDFEFIKGDIRDYETIFKIFSAGKNFEVVLHLAAQVAVTTSVKNPRRDFEDNALGTFNLLEAIRETKQNPVFIFSSTNKVYGNLESVALVEGEKKYEFGNNFNAVSENQSLDFHSPYGCSKGAADQYVRDYSRIYDLKTVVLRQSCIYGPRQFGIEDQGWVAWFIIAHLLGKPITVYGNGKQVRDILYIGDLIACFDSVIKNIDAAKGGIYNVGGGPKNQISLLEFIDLLSEISGKKLDPAFSDWRPGDQPIYVSDIGKARSELGWTPQTDVKTGIEKLYAWVRENEQTIRDVIL